MSIKLMYITNRVDVAKLAQDCGVDWIFVDLEFQGKAERQSGRDTVISCHGIDDVRALRSVVDRSSLLVRINPIGVWSESEINNVIESGADIVMLPFFKSKTEVEKFAEYVAGRAKTCLLLETPEAVDDIEKILSVGGVDYVHIGLNDLHIAYGMRFMFELLADGTVDRLAKIISGFGIPFGFGGVARMGERVPPGASIIAEHYRTGSSQVILSRSFCNTNAASLESVADSFRSGIEELRSVERGLIAKHPEFFTENRNYVRDEIFRVAREGEER